MSVKSITPGPQLESISSSTKRISDDSNNFVTALNKLSSNTQDTDPTKTKQPTNDNLPDATANTEMQEIVISPPNQEIEVQPVVIAPLNIEEPAAALDEIIPTTDIIKTPNIPDIKESNSTQSEDVFIPEISVPNLEEEFIPDAITSSEVREQIPVFTPLLVPKQETKTDVIDDTDISAKIPVQPLVLPDDTIIQENMLGSIQQDNFNDSLPQHTSKEPQADGEASVISVATLNSNDQKIESKSASTKALPQTSPLSMVESVKVEPISGADDTNPEMSFSSNKEKLELDMQNLQKEPASEIENFSTIAKPIITQTVDATTDSEQADMKSISNQLKSAVENIHNINGKRITITLTPESLGRVEVELTLKAGQITAIEIKAVKPETLQMLEKNSQMLQDTLKEVTSSNDASLSFNLKEGNHQHNRQEQSAKKADIAPFDINNIDDSKDVVKTPRTLTQANSTANNDTTNSRINMKL